MKVTLRWLKDYVDFDLGPRELAAALTMRGFEVEAVTPVGGDYTGVVTALIEKVEPHPQADKLTLCTVFDGSERFSVICGAPNTEAGRIGVLARIGAQLPEGKLKKTKIRGVESFGMLCSRRELGLSTDHSGIWLLPAGTPLGVEPLQALELDDWLLEMDVTPNRPDALSVLGLAREVSALTGNPLKYPTLSFEEIGGAIDGHMKIAIADHVKCPRYCGILVRGVKIAPSPAWLAHRLEATGIRAINNIVDITNFVMMEYGQPLHAFDYHFLEGHTINVRRATPGEKMTTLDEMERTLTDDDLLICDGIKPVALAGVMGGLNSLVTDETADVFIEAAYFEPGGIRRSSRRLGLSSESSHRFERGTGIDNPPLGAHRAAQLMVALGGGTIVSGFLDAYPQKAQPTVITLRPSRINRLLGIELPGAEMARLLNSIEVRTEPVESDLLRAFPPSYRVDLTREADLAEEVARLYGYDRIAPSIHLGADRENRPWKLRQLLRTLRHELVGMGLTELNTNSLIDAPSLAAVGASVGLRLANPQSEDLAFLRTQLLPSLLKSIANNQARQLEDLAFFEARRVYLPGQEGSLPAEPYFLGLAMTGRRFEFSWNQPGDRVDFYDLKGVVERLLAALGIADWSWRRTPEPGPYLPGVCAEVCLGDTVLGKIGKLQAQVAERFEIQGEVFAGELAVEKLTESVQTHSSYRPVSKYPPVLRDIALLTEMETPVDEMAKAIRGVNMDRIAEVTVFDLYTGQGVPEGKKSVAFSMRYQDIAQSLSDKEADKLTKRILQVLQERFGAILRE